MTGGLSLAVVVPTFRGRWALWLGIRDLLAWQHPRLRHLSLVIVDDATPEFGLREASLSFRDRELRVLVNATNLGQARSTWRGVQACAADWVLLLEDDLLHWDTTLDATLDTIDDGTDLVSFARPPSFFAARPLRRAAQVLVRHAFRRRGISMIDPTSPIKAFPHPARSGLEAGTSAARSLQESLLLSSRRPREVLGKWLAWEQRPSRYSIWSRMLANATAFATVLSAGPKKGGKADAGDAR